ncbi:MULTISPECIES: hypothetical protein [unclassified Chitinophaga]|uniref:hypothetical protein n=1 Tax=unclassified Chitinophaga TaxID=2619133 RepID=UPI0009D3DC42|nr:MULTISPECIES: hypothetical protein [unclassified Chitinophaga]OMP77792.1 hypothetical protein BW716_17895 [[Flexibacter] sp. ATCC 35208]WPV68944.1 hypothetical protein QQL36_09440 [Chitinophaga sp. LS1]
MPLKSYLLPILALFALTFSSCKKKDGTTTVKPAEEGLKVTLANVTEASYTAAAGTTYTFQAQVTSKLPASGVTITVTAVTDPGGINIPQNAVAPSSSGAIEITLIGLEPLRTVLVTVVITSVDNPDNTISKTFWITNKSE